MERKGKTKVNISTRRPGLIEISPFPTFFINKNLNNILIKGKHKEWFLISIELNLLQYGGQF